jgi:outer membrane receptor protein involved in Fe transport
MLDIDELEIGPDNQPTGIVDMYEENPVELAAYIQDKIEVSYLVVNAGLRWDWVDPRSEGWADPENPDSGLAAAEPQQQLSPRLGLAHPITEDISLYFAYGHFFQYPHYSSLFMNTSYLDTDTLANRSQGIVGNRMLKAQKTVAYEVGLKGNLTDVLGFTLTAYYKDITDLVGSKQVRVGTWYNYGLFRNIDYASVVGVELGLHRTLADHWSLEGNYTYSVAKGNSSEQTVGYWNAYYQEPEVQQEYYLDFDRRHVLNAVFVYQSGQLYRKNFLSSLASDITLGIIATWASGLPYTPYTGAGERLAVTNSERMDPSATVDLRFSKVLTRAPMEVTFLADVDNLFDLVNPLRVNTRTGEPWESPLESNEIDFDYNHDPAKVDIPRMIKVGIQARF